MTGLGNADDVYKHYLKVIEENKQFEKKLEIAVKALEEYANTPTYDWIDSQKAAQEALAKIKENN